MKTTRLSLLPRPLPALLGEIDGELALGTAVQVRVGPDWHLYLTVAEVDPVAGEVLAAEWQMEPSSVVRVSRMSFKRLLKKYSGPRWERNGAES